MILLQIYIQDSTHSNGKFITCAISFFSLSDLEKLMSLYKMYSLLVEPVSMQSTTNRISLEEVTASPRIIEDVGSAIDELINTKNTDVLKEYVMSVDFSLSLPTIIVYIIYIKPYFANATF